MALSLALKEKIVSRHNEMFDAFFHGDIDAFTTWWADDIIVYGTAISEVFTNKQAAIDFYTSTSDQVAGLVRIENKIINVFDQNGYVILTEESDLYVKVAEEWMFYHHSRLTGVWSEIMGEWYMTHVHISYPDGYAGEGEQINLEQLRSENIKLQAAVAERTAELEQKNRELEIEIALDKIRTRSLSMHHSNEILEVAYLVSEKLKQLSLGIDAAAIILLEENRYEYWIANDEGSYTTKIIEETNNLNPSLLAKEFIKHHKTGTDFTYCADGEDKRIHWEYLFRNTGFEIVPQERRQFILEQPCYNICVSFHDHISLTVVRYNNKDYSLSERAIVKKFCKVFAQAYTRFMDLYTAEKQTKDAKIEMALEKVRSRSLIMQSSDELSEVVKTVFDNLRDLQFNLTDSAVVINLFQEDSDDIVQWITDNEQTYPRSFRHPHFDNPILNDIKSARKKGVDYFSATYSFDDKNAFWRYYFEYTDFRRFPDHIKEDILQRKSYAQSMALQQFTGILYPNIEGRVLNDDEAQILKRFSVVFEQAYIRFLDLKKAEEQALEARIEAALERLRARAMGMQKSDDILGICKIMFSELQLLGFSDLRNTMINFWDDANHSLTDYDFSDYAGGHKSVLAYNSHPVFEQFVQQIKQSKDAFAKLVVNNEQLESWKQRRRESGEYEDPRLNNIPELYYYFYSIGVGAIGISTFKSLSEEQLDVLKRFRNVFDFAYRRYLDVTQAEAQAREAQIEAALERVRSRTLAMQKSDELAETAAEVFRQLITLGIEPNRLYIGIIKGETGDMEMWATDEDGSHIGKKFMFNKNENDSVKKLYDGWFNKQVSVIVNMEGKELEDYLHYLNHVMHIPFKGGLAQTRRVQSVAYFSKGFIGMASPDGQGDETIQLLERFAAVFNLTFTRFNDLKIAEAHADQAEKDLILLKAEKKRTEEALNELQLTQKQLIQSEKMASLGELTAGIAHEIQNPLNFVNNFSEVSNELIDEMKIELDKGEIETAKEIAEDVKQNLEKINHHGKRADAIVKGMLQHSRTSSGKKETTDINALCDEYLRLAYHGLRAKDKSFNIKFETKFDATIGLIDIMPQDIGRVLLNLINNAFYATDQRRKKGEADYEPMVIVATKNLKDSIGITVTDNGMGIPDAIKEKIFQPFFTTKPTGQGTGLGLSLSYDIVKSHAGKIEIQSEENSGTSFNIQLPKL